MLSIFRKEINSFFNSLTGYLVIIVFLSFIGTYLWVFSESSVLEYGYADMESLFSFGPIAFLLLIPAITMRTFAEEKKEGTIELLLTRPLTDMDIILGKYLASLVLVIFSLVPTLVYYWSLHSLGDSVGNIDSAAVFSSYLGLILLGAVFTSIGIFCSVLTSNQIISFILAIVFCYFLYEGFFRLASFDLWGNYSAAITRIGMEYHYNALSRGVIDSRNVFYFISIISMMLLSTKLVLGSRKW